MTPEMEQAIARLVDGWKISDTRRARLAVLLSGDGQPEAIQDQTSVPAA